MVKVKPPWNLYGYGKSHYVFDQTKLGDTTRERGEILLTELQINPVNQVRTYRLSGKGQTAIIQQEGGKKPQTNPSKSWGKTNRRQEETWRLL